MGDVFEEFEHARDLVLSCERFGVHAGPIVVSPADFDRLTRGATYCPPCDRFYSGRCPVHG